MATSQTHQRKVALITGATSGIGAASADLLARDGWIAVISGRREAEGNNVIEGIKAAGGEALFIQSDVNTEEAVKALVQKVLDTYGRLDAAVNNAGISTDAAPFAETSTQAFEAMWTTNVKGVYWCMQQEIFAMRKTGGGAIVNLASIAGLNGIALTSTYCATKHAVVGLTKAAAVDHALENIRINAIAPGAIRTDILNYAIEGGSYPIEAIEDMFPMRKMGKPVDIAKGIKFLIDNDYCTGSVLSVDGGYGAR